MRSTSFLQGWDINSFKAPPAVSLASGVKRSLGDFFAPPPPPRPAGLSGPQFSFVLPCGEHLHDSVATRPIKEKKFTAAPNRHFAAPFWGHTKRERLAANTSWKVPVRTADTRFFRGPERTAGSSTCPRMASGGRAGRFGAYLRISTWPSGAVESSVRSREGARLQSCPPPGSAIEKKPSWTPAQAPPPLTHNPAVRRSSASVPAADVNSWSGCAARKRLL